MICSALSEDAISYSTCKKWFQKFKNRNLDLKNEEHPGLSKKFEKEALEEFLEENPYCSQSLHLE